jgi:hypothetical protein
VRRIRSLAFVCIAVAFSAASIHSQSPHILRAPSLSDTAIAFRYADDIWTVPRNGGVARRLGKETQQQEARSGGLIGLLVVAVYLVNRRSCAGGFQPLRPNTKLPGESPESLLAA